MALKKTMLIYSFKKKEKMFEEKTLEEISKMTLEEQTAYQKAKKAHESEVLKSQIEEATKNSATKEEITVLTAKNTEVIKEIERLGLELKKLSAGGQKEEPKTFEYAIAKTFADNAENLKKVADKELQKLSLVVKSPVTVGVNNTVDSVGSASHYSVTSNTGIVSVLRKRVLKYLENVSVGRLSVDKPYAMWIEELDEQGNPIFLAEGATKPQGSVRYEEREKKAVKIAFWGKVTEEMLRYLPNLVTFFQNNLMRRLEIKMEDELFNGQGGANQLSGLADYCTAFNGGGLKTEKPAYADVFRAIALQVEKAFGEANAVFVRPDILSEMDVEKADDSGTYLLPPFKAANGNEIAGMRLISTNGMPNGIDFMGGDLSVVNVEFTDNLRIDIDRTENDMLTNKRTILVEAELVQFVSANDQQVLVKGDMATALAAIQAS